MRCGLIGGYVNGSSLTENEKYPVGLLPLAPPETSGSAASLLRAAEAFSAEYDARLRGIRYVIDLDGQQCELGA